MSFPEFTGKEKVDFSIPFGEILEIDLEKNKADRAAFVSKAEKVLFTAISVMFAFGFYQFGA